MRCVQRRREGVRGGGGVTLGARRGERNGEKAHLVDLVTAVFF